MDNRKVISNPNPRDKANILSVLFWTWTIRLFRKGYNKILKVEDIYDPISADKSSTLGDRLEKKWFEELKKAEKSKRRPSLLRAICWTFAYEFFIIGVVHTFNEFVLKLGTPILLGGLLQYFKPNTTTTYEMALWYAFGIALLAAINSVTFNQTLFDGFHVGGKIRIAMCSVVYRKALRLSKTALGETAPGKVVNLVANDVNRFEFASILLPFMWSAPLSTVVISCLLYNDIGWPVFIGMVVLLVIVPLQAYLGKLSSIYRLQTAIKTDERVRLMDEIISGVQVIKMYAWEKPFCALVALARKLELKVVRKSSYIRGIYMTFNLFTTRMALFATLIAMMLQGYDLSADKVFVYMSFYNILALIMSSYFVRGFAELSECNVAVNRLQNFLMYEEFETGNVTNVMQAKATNGNVNNVSKPMSSYINETVDFGESDETKENIIMSVKSSLKADDMDGIDVKTNQVKNSPSSQDETWALQMKHLTAKWDLHSSESTLENVMLEVNRNKLYIVIGMVGAGKSSFISTILGELKLIQGTTIVKGEISYADQDAWVFGASVRQNIIFGQNFDRQRYRKVVKVCALQRDFKQFPQGDQTIVGERGSSLSGGQKARINLARAVYREADIYLLDDPLSAVDAHVGKHLFEECLQRFLKGKTVILATHQLQYIKDADSIILLDQGKVLEYSDYRHLLTDHPEYGSLIAEEQTHEINDDSSTERFQTRRKSSSSSIKSRSSTKSGVDTDDDCNANEHPEQMEGFLEGTSKGTVKGNLLTRYFTSGSNSFVTLIMLGLYILTQICVSLNDAYIPILVNSEESRAYCRDLHIRENSSNITADLLINATLPAIQEEDILPRDYYMYIYAAIVLSIFIVGLTRSYIFYGICLSCSQKLHDLVFDALIRAPMSFFDSNPSGRILNRFSKDLGGIDELLPKGILDALQSILAMFGSLVVTCLVNYLFLIPIIVIAFFFYFIRKIYLKTSKNVKRLEGMTRSPVFTHLNATLNGLTTIRAYKAETILKEEFDKLQDVHTSSWFMFIATSSAFGFSLDVFCCIFTTLVTFSFLLLQDHFSGGQVGLAITQVMSLTFMIQWGMRQSAEVTNQLMSVERILEYSELKPEPNLRDPGIRKRKKIKKLKNDEQKNNSLMDIPKDWPDHGYIEFKEVYMRYSEDDAPVLKGLTMTIQPTEKVGIVGRTGAGKSSLISALFRLAHVEGAIEIDGISTGSISLEDLRKNISIIPQNPVLFSGTLRRNLDPFNEFSDKHLWEVLEEVELKDSVTLTGHGLDHRVLDRGSNYSTGQRQLICLARAILRNNRVLMLDEATANVDPHTDALIQRTIRTKFANCTVLTVAHRLNTIMDSDKVLVMDKGRLVEFDHPYILLQNLQGQFSSLVKETGRAMYEQLNIIARDAYIAKKNN